MAAEVYEDAAEFLKDETKVFRLLKTSAAEEYEHYHIMASAANLLDSEMPQAPRDFIVDNDTRRRIEGVFEEIRDYLNHKEFDSTTLLTRIVEVEWSEWNDIFLYVINVLKVNHRSFAALASKVEQHRPSFINNLESYPELRERIKEFARMEPVWREQILILEDNEAVVELLKAILEAKYPVQTARSEPEARQLLEKQFFDLVISDIDLEEGDGLHLYREWKSANPDSPTRFLFHSGFMRAEDLEYVKSHQLPYLQKPSGISQFQKTVDALLNKINP